MQRRKFIGGFAALFAIGNLPASAQNILTHDLRVANAIEILHESWLVAPWHTIEKRVIERVYRVVARCGNQDKYGVCLVTEDGYQDLNVRANVRADAMDMIRIAFKAGAA